MSIGSSNASPTWNPENWPETLFSPSIGERWKNTNQWFNEHGKTPGATNDILVAEAEASWPPWIGQTPAASGAINAWLVTFGPSEGKSDPKDGKTRWVNNLYFGVKHTNFDPSSDSKGFFETLLGQRGFLPPFFQKLDLTLRED